MVPGVPIGYVSIRNSTRLRRQEASFAIKGACFFIGSVMNKKPLIIVADEDKDMRFLIRMYLRDYIFQLSEVHTAEDLKNSLKEKVPVAVITNFMLGDTPAIDIAAEAAFSGLGIPVIIMGLEGFDLFEEHPGVSDYLIKPFTKEQFIEALEKSLGEESMKGYQKENNASLSFSSTQPSKMSAPASGVKKIIVADDDENILTLLKIILGGYQVDTVTSGDELVDAASSGDYDIIISDVIMPKLSGWKAVKALRDEGIETPVIFSSGLVKDRELYETLKPSGISMFILKPFKREEMLRAVAAFLNDS